MTTQIKEKYVHIPRPKCPLCNRKINHLDIVCKCGGIFCMEHTLPEKHNCQFDFKTFGRNKMMEKIEIDKEKKPLNAFYD
jgi:predicted nucleic acid binding AN1-type Zn finger protein